MLATRYVLPLREGGSLPGLVEGDDCGMYVVKFRAAGQGLKALVAEVIAGGLAGALGLPVPEMVLIEIDPALGRSEPDPEINELVTGSAGINFGIDFLPGSLDLAPATAELVDPGFAARVVWFDALITNVDRTPRNPNLLVWHGAPWLIDHGAAIYQHHGTADLPSRAADPFPLIGDHVLLGLAGSIEAVDEGCAAALDAEAIDAALDDVPDDWLGAEPGPAAARDQYRRYLRDRLAAPRAWVATAELARKEVRGVA